MVASREIRLKSRPVGMPGAENFRAVPDPPARRSPGEEHLDDSRPVYARPHGRSRELCLPPSSWAANRCRAARSGKSSLPMIPGSSVAISSRRCSGGGSRSTHRRQSSQKLETFGLPPTGLPGCCRHAGPDGQGGPVEDRGAEAWRRGVCLRRGRRGRLGRVSDRQDQRAHGHRIGGRRRQGAFLKEIGVDHVIDYKAAGNLAEAVLERPPTGSMYFDMSGARTWRPP